MFSVYMKVHEWLHSPPKREQTAVMNYVSKFLSNFKEFYNEINSATLTGAIDVVVIRLEDGSYACSPFHVRFGKIGVLRSREKVVDIEVNGEQIAIHMKLGESGEAFFVEETEDPDDDVPSHLATSPIPSYDIEKEWAKLTAKEAQQNPKSKSSDYVTQNKKQNNHGGVYIQNNNEITDKNSTLSDTTDSIHHKTNKIDSSTNRTNWSVPLTNDRTSNLSTKLANQGRVSVSEGTLFLELDRRSNKLDLTESGDRGLNLPRSHSSSDGLVVDKSLSKSNLPQTSVSAQIANGDEDKLKVKKKRRKRSVIRKRKEREMSAQSSSMLKDSSDDEPEEIFQMDVDDEGDDGNAGLSSSSVTSLINRKSIPISTDDVSSFKSSSVQTRGIETESSPVSSHSWPYKSSLQLNLEIHPFSDGDVTPVLSPVASRPPTPKSDTEYEIQKQETASQTETGDNRWSWTWGELPVPPKTHSEKQGKENAISDDEGIHPKRMEQDSDRSMFRMFRFMRSTKKIRHQPESEGIYLDDLNPDEMDPEVAKLYFPQRSSSLHLQNAADMKRSSVHAKDEDIESGNGSSLPQSPYSTEGGLGSMHGIDSDTDDRHPMFDFKGYNDLAISVCGGLADNDGVIPEERFLQNIVTYDDFCEHPETLDNPDLVVRLNNKYYNWQTVAPMVLSGILYQRSLPDKTISSLIKQHMPKKQKKSEMKGYSLWWPSWRRPTNAEDDGSKQDVNKKSSVDETGKSSSMKTESEAKIKMDDISPTVNVEPSTPILEKSSALSTKIDSSSTKTDIGGLNVPHQQPHEEIDSADTNASTPEKRSFYTGNEKYKKTLRLTSEQISHLNLHGGPNEVVFSVTTAYQGTTRCKCHIYLWNYDDKIVISDIDGTITKSDVLGHILPIIGKDWAQSGVAQLFTKIKNNGYQFLYLSARAIGQAHITREYLKSVRQGDVCLPDGPLLLNPSSLISAFHREVIEKKPEEFKISCLKDIQALFPSTNPFYAGYGNRVNDVWAYRAVGIPISRIFTINHKGELKHELTQTFQSTYSGLSYVVDHLFPPLRRSSLRDGILTSDFEGSDEFSAFTYWRQPIPEVHIDIAVNKSPEKKVDEKKSGKVTNVVASSSSSSSSATPTTSTSTSNT